MGKEDEAFETAEELEGEGSLEVGMEEEWFVPNACYSFADPAVRLTKRSKRREAQKLMDVICDVLSDGKELRQYVKKAGDYEGSDIARTDDALSRVRFQGKKLRRASEGCKASALLYKNDILNVLRKQMPPISSHSVFRS